MAEWLRTCIVFGTGLLGFVQRMDYRLGSGFASFLFLLFECAWNLILYKYSHLKGTWILPLDKHGTRYAVFYLIRIGCLSLSWIPTLSVWPLHLYSNLLESGIRRGAWCALYVLLGVNRGEQSSNVYQLRYCSTAISGPRWCLGTCGIVLGPHARRSRA